jgi:hypothetical protein
MRLHRRMLRAFRNSSRYIAALKGGESFASLRVTFRCGTYWTPPGAEALAWPART